MMEICSNQSVKKKVGWGGQMIMGLGRQTVLTLLLWLILRRQ